MHGVKAMLTTNADEFAKKSLAISTPDFMEVAGHKVYTTPYANIMVVENALAA